MHFVSGDIPTAPFNARVRIRYKAPEEEALVTPLDAEHVQVTFARAQRAITPGQAAVFYSGKDGDEVLCGGIIE
jgi:tRNA-specific 2-thiouridylase